MGKPRAGGGLASILYSFARARDAGGYVRMWKALRSKNACKTCALGMGGQSGGMVNELGRFPEVCKKSIQAMAADMQGRVREDFFETFDFDHLSRFTPRELEYSGRIVTPLLAGPDDRSYREISWDDAISRISERMKATPPDDSFFYFSGRSSNEAGFILQIFARLFGTNNVNNCSYYCHQASGVGLSSVTGSGTASIELEDLDKADLVVLIGGNPASNHPRFMRSLMDLKRRGGRVVVINPLREEGLVRFHVPSDVRSLFFGTDIADLYVQPHIGGDIALLKSAARILLDRKAIDEEFVRDHCDGWDELKRELESIDVRDTCVAAGVSRPNVEALADEIAGSKSTIYCWTMGITHHEHGVENVQMIANLAMMRGMLGRPGAGLLPLRGHSNVQGIGSIGATPKLKEAIFERLEEEFRVELPTSEGLDTLGCMERAAAGDVGFAFLLGGNLFGSNPDSAFAEEALRTIGMTVFLSTTLNSGHIRGRGKESIILPVLARDEEAQATTQESMFNFVRLSDGGASRHTGPRSEVEVIADLAERVLGPQSPVDWSLMRVHREIRQAIARIVPGYERIGAIDTSREEFQIDGRTFHEPRFGTPSGRAQFHVVETPVRAEDSEGLTLMTVRSEGQFNTVVYDEDDRYRGQERRDVILMNEEDIRRLGLEEDQRVRVFSDTGAMTGVLVRPYEIRAGNAAMYYPEANILVPRAADERSKTPAFKSIRVRVQAEHALPVVAGADA